MYKTHCLCTHCNQQFPINSYLKKNSNGLLPFHLNYLLRRLRLFAINVWKMIHITFYYYFRTKVTAAFAVGLICQQSKCQRNYKCCFKFGASESLDFAAACNLTGWIQYRNRLLGQRVYRHSFETFVDVIWCYFDFDWVLISWNGWESSIQYSPFLQSPPPRNSVRPLYARCPHKTPPTNSNLMIPSWFNTSNF